MAASILDMSTAVRDIALLERGRIKDLDDLALRESQPIDVAALRDKVETALEAFQFLAALAPWEEQFRVWLEQQKLRTGGVAAPRPSMWPKTVPQIAGSGDGG